MIKKVGIKIKEALSQLKGIDKELKLNEKSNDNIKNGQQILLDFQQISQLFTNNEFIPFTSWSISPSTILHVLNDVLLNDRKTIIEFGSGASTLYLAKFLKLQKLDQVCFYTVDADKVWLRKIQELAKKYGIEEYLNFIHAPLAPIEDDICFKGQKIWYDTKNLEFLFTNNNTIDLLLVDGPWGGSSPYSRFSAVPFLENHLSPNVAIFLDDTFRDQEMEIALEWQKILDLNIKHFNKYSLLTTKQTYNVEPFGINKWRA